MDEGGASGGEGCLRRLFAADTSEITANVPRIPILIF
jgi:hypothetical protein